MRVRGRAWPDRFPATRCHRRPSSAARTSRARPGPAPRSEFGQIAKAEHLLDDVPAFNSPHAGRTEQPALAFRARRCRGPGSLRSLTLNRLPRMFAMPMNHGLVIGTSTIFGTAITSPASASRISHCSPPQASPIATIRPAPPSCWRAGTRVPAETREGRVWRHGPCWGRETVSRARRSWPAARRG